MCINESVKLIPVSIICARAIHAENGAGGAKSRDQFIALFRLQINRLQLCRSNRDIFAFYHFVARMIFFARRNLSFTGVLVMRGAYRGKGGRGGKSSP